MFSINGREYEWADISLNVGGISITGFRSISYKEKQEIEPIYGKGRLPIGFICGNRTFEGSITFTQSEIIAMRKALTDNMSLLDVKIDSIVICYESEYKNIQDVSFVDVRFIEFEEKMSQGDKFMEIEIPFVALLRLN